MVQWLSVWLLASGCLSVNTPALLVNCAVLPEQQNSLCLDFLICTMGTIVMPTWKHGRDPSHQDLQQHSTHLFAIPFSLSTHSKKDISWVVPLSFLSSFTIKFSKGGK